MSKLGMMVIALWLMAVPAIAGDKDMAASSGSQWFVVHLRHHDVPGMDEVAMGAAMMGHIEYMNGLYDQGILYMAGPYSDDSGIGAGVVRANSEAEIRASMGQDPAAKAGIFTIESIHPWNPFFNRPMNQRMTMEDFKKMMASGMPEMGDKPMPVEPDGGIGTTPEPSGSGEGGMPDMSMGAVGFIEIPSKNVHESQSFYSHVFGWDFSGMMDMSSPEMAAMAEEFLMFHGPDGLAGAFTTSYTPAADSGPVLYINCSSVAAKLKEIEAAGGKTVMASMALPADWGYIGHFTDPHGNRLGLWSMGP
jgi:predicted enzyme related to lactoylglutathione lyase/uncharacterized protein YciI